MATTFETVILGFGNNTGIEVPDANVEALGHGKRPPVKVVVNGYAYQSTVAPMSGRNMIAFAKAHREASGLNAGDAVTVTLELDDGERSVDVPVELTDALRVAELTDAFAKLSYTNRKEAARSVAEAKAAATRERRIAKILDSLSSRS